MKESSIIALTLSSSSRAATLSSDPHKNWEYNQHKITEYVDETDLNRIKTSQSMSIGIENLEIQMHWQMDKANHKNNSHHVHSNPNPHTHTHTTIMKQSLLIAR